MAKTNAEKNVRKWFDDKVTVMTFGDDKSMEKKLKKAIQDRFIKKIKGKV